MVAESAGQAGRECAGQADRECAGHAGCVCRPGRQGVCRPERGIQNNVLTLGAGGGKYLQEQNNKYKY